MVGRFFNLILELGSSWTVLVRQDDQRRFSISLCPRYSSRRGAGYRCSGLLMLGVYVWVEALPERIKSGLKIRRDAVTKETFGI